MEIFALFENRQLGAATVDKTSQLQECLAFTTDGLVPLIIFMTVVS